MNARYRKNLQERKHFWKNMNSNQNPVNSKTFLVQNTNSSPIQKPKSKSFQNHKFQNLLKSQNLIVLQKQIFQNLSTLQKMLRAKVIFFSELEISLKEYEANLKSEEKAFGKKMAKKHKEFIQ